MGTQTVIVIVSVVGAALVVVLAYFFYRYRTNNKYTTKTVADMSKWIADSKDTHAADIQIQDKEKNEGKFMAMTDIYGGQDNEHDGGDVDFDNRVLI